MLITPSENAAGFCPAVVGDPSCSTPLPQPPDERGREAAGAGREMVRVLHIINGEHYAGAERVQDLLAARLPEFGFEVGFACLKPDRFPRERKLHHAALYDVSMRSRLDFAVAGKLMRVIRRGGFRILHTHTPRSALMGSLAAARTGVGWVHHMHSPASCDTNGRFRNWLNRRVERISLAGASRIIAVSASLARRMTGEGLAAHRISVVPNGVPQPQSPPPRLPPLGQWTLGVVALFRPRKGVEILLDSLALLRARGLPVRLRAVGSFETPDYERQVKARCGRLGLDRRVCWTGFARDVGDELVKMDLFVLPSLFGEGMPMVVLEAMAAGTPVVATSVEGVPEVIRDGLDGVLARPGDAEHLAGAIARVVRGDLDWRRLRQSALRRCAENFSDRRMAEGVAAVYRCVLGST